mmetsp:Transcript_113248/g.283614  ORF Transcript_113248/g.283614 Transcript_113248/m.283614 type:complete len:216 (-) Transcript_113248:1913-2560(-)
MCLMIPEAMMSKGGNNALPAKSRWNVMRATLRNGAWRTWSFSSSLRIPAPHLLFARIMTRAAAWRLVLWQQPLAMRPSAKIERTRSPWVMHRLSSGSVVKVAWIYSNLSSTSGEVVILACKRLKMARYPASITQESFSPRAWLMLERMPNIALGGPKSAPTNVRRRYSQRSCSQSGRCTTPRPTHAIIFLRRSSSGKGGMQATRASKLACASLSC